MFRFRIDDVAAESYSPLGRANCSQPDKNSQLLKVGARTTAKKMKNFAESDRIRDELKAAGIVLEDGPQGTSWRRA